MKHLHKSAFENIPSRQRAHLINTSVGFRNCSLIATKSTKNTSSNLAVFNSVNHIGSDPALLGFILRPLTTPRETYTHIKESGFFTINHVHADFIKKAHQTAAKYPHGISEFEKVGLTESYQDDFYVPYVKESKIQIGCSYVNEYLIKENNTVLLIGAIEHLYFDPSIQHSDGWLQLDKIDSVSNLGIDGYAQPKVIDRFSYAKPDTKPSSILEQL